MKAEYKEKLKRMTEDFDSVMLSGDFIEDDNEDDLEACYTLLSAKIMMNIASDMALLHNLNHSSREELENKFTKNGALTLEEARSAISMNIAMSMESALKSVLKKML